MDLIFAQKERKGETRLFSAILYVGESANVGMTVGSLGCVVCRQYAQLSGGLTEVTVS